MVPHTSMLRFAESRAATRPRRTSTAAGHADRAATLAAPDHSTPYPHSAVHPSQELSKRPIQGTHALRTAAAAAVPTHQLPASAAAAAKPCRRRATHSAAGLRLPPPPPAPLPPAPAPSSASGECEGDVGL